MASWLSLGGLHEYWQQGDQSIASYTILTTQPNALMATIHTRMPVIIGDEEIDGVARTRNFRR